MISEGDYIYDEVIEATKYLRKEYNLESIKNRPRHVLVSEILRLHEKLVWLRDKYIESTKERDL